MTELKDWLNSINQTKKNLIDSTQQHLYGRPNNDGKNLWSFELWYDRYTCEYIDEDWYRQPIENGDIGQVEKETSKDRLIQIGSLFDKFMCSPNDLYFCEKRQEKYAIGSRYSIYKNFEELIVGIHRYREKYEKLFLYDVSITSKSNGYKIKFAAFPTKMNLEHGGQKL